MLGRRWYVPWLFLAPALGLTLLTLWLPMVNTGVLAFTDAQALGGGRFTGLDNFHRLAGDDQFWRVTGNTLLYVVVVVPCMVVLPLLLAQLVHAKLPGMSMFRAVFYSPVVASMVVVGLIWTWLLRSDGLVNALLLRLHAIAQPVPFLTDGQLMLFSCMAVTIWKGLGYYMVIYLAALANVPKELHEAAAVDGASSLRRFVSVTLPAIRSSMLLVGTLSAIAATKVFSEIYVLTSGSGGPNGAAESLVFYIRDVGLGLSGQVGYASAMSLALFVVTLGFSLLAVRMNRSQEVVR